MNFPATSRAMAPSPLVTRALESMRARISSSVKGRSYEYRSQVPRDLAPDAKGVFRCVIEGSSPYDVEIDPERGLGQCTCPYWQSMGECKHVAAVLAELLQRAGDVVASRAEPPRARPRPSKPAPHERALQAIEGSFAQLRRATAPIHGELTWRVSIEDGVADLQPLIRLLQPDGRLGAVRPYSLETFAELTGPAVESTPEDRRLQSVLRSIASHSAGGASLYSRSSYYQDEPALGEAATLELLAGHPRIEVEGHPGSVRVERATAGIAVVPSGDACRLTLSLDGKPLTLDRSGAAADGVVAFVPEERKLLVAPCRGEVLNVLAAVMHARELEIPIDAAAALVDRVSRGGTSVPIALPPELLGRPVPYELHVSVVVTPDPEGGALIAVRARPIANGPHVLPGVGEVRLRATVAGERLATDRALAGEVRLAREVAHVLALETDRPGPGPWAVDLDRDDQVLDLIKSFEERLANRPDVSLEWPENARRPRLVRFDKKAFRVDVSARQDWFGLEGGLQVDGATVALAHLLEAARAGRRYVAVGNGGFVELAKVFEGRLGDLALLTREARGQKVEVARAAAPLVAELLPEDVRAPVAWTDLLARVRELKKKPPRPSKKIAAELRPYQVEGYRWLRRLEALGTGGCLADDMGLGKTLQAIAVLVDRASTGPALVVAPTSVGFNWVRELERFAPGLLRARSYRDEDRADLLESAAPGDVVIASYGLLRRDHEAIAGVEWGTFVLDEAQAIKNGASLTARAARGIRAGWTVALTGTPIENNLGELWSLFQVIVPGLFGSWEQFAERFARPIESGKDAARRAALARIVRPFILRRTKAQVLTELPPRTEQRLECELSKAERALYENARLEAIAALAAPRTKGQDARFEVLAALTKLRQLACHARLVHSSAPAISAKLAVFLEQVESILESEHRVLVFSQFTRHLDLVGTALSKRAIKTLRLDGSTPARERQRLVDRFQQGEAPVFLVSLKAGGTGLNLTAADYVFLLDPWWNPAVEDQAADRAHRIGQTRAVTVVRIVAKDTIEEKVLALHGEKRDLVAGVLDGTERASKLSTDELLELLREGARKSSSELDETGDAEVVSEVAPATGSSWEEWVERFQEECARTLAPSSAKVYLGEIDRASRDVEDLAAREKLLAAVEPSTRKRFSSVTRVAWRRFVRFLEGDEAISAEDAERAVELIGQSEPS